MKPVARTPLPAGGKGEWFWAMAGSEWDCEPKDDDVDDVWGGDPNLGPTLAAP